MDWLFVRVHLKKKKRPYYLIFSVVKSLSRRVEPWFYGEALPGCCVYEWAFLFLFSNCLTDVAFLHFVNSKRPKLQDV